MYQRMNAWSNYCLLHVNETKWALLYEECKHLNGSKQVSEHRCELSIILA